MELRHESPNRCFDARYSDSFTVDDLGRIFNNSFRPIVISDKLLNPLELVCREALKHTFESYRQYNKFMARMRKTVQFDIMVSKSILYKHYIKLIELGRISHNYNLEKFMRNKGARSRSGILSVTVFTSGSLMGSPDMIATGGCPMNCHYCPFEKDDHGTPTQPRSYLSTEPGNMRASEHKHHPMGQVLARLVQLGAIGHLSDNPRAISKIELIISGGTFNFYPREYILWFSTCVYYACNTYYETKANCTHFGRVRKMGSIEYEQNMNETASIRIIGLTIETRPDYITPYNKQNPKVIDFSQLKLFRLIGTTRVQIGVQSTKDSILKKVNRGCTSKHNKLGIRRLKQNGFKTDIHIMYDLPGSSPDIDTSVINDIVDDPDYQADQWKLYPTETTPYTKIKEWYDLGEYTPYAEDHTHGHSYKLLNVIIHSLARVPHYIRVNRVVRDIPHISIEGGLKCSNFRQLAKNKMDKDGILCWDIREREVKHKVIKSDDIILDITIYTASGGDEYFIQFCSKNKRVLYGFVRLRLNRTTHDTMECLKHCALVRELHVYGQHIPLGSKNESSAQHHGFGTRLLEKAEEIACVNGFPTIAVISGIGVRHYYAKKKYVLGTSGYMYKDLLYKWAYVRRRPIHIPMAAVCLYLAALLLICYIDII